MFTILKALYKYFSISYSWQPWEGKFYNFYFIDEEMETQRN
jgi:hypothetical protein